jgi:uncharacterized membrane protein YuzA (DUF378 family)
MDGVLLLFAIVAAFFAFDVIAALFGVDSRYESADPASPAGGLSF